MATPPSQGTRQHRGVSVGMEHQITGGQGKSQAGRRSEEMLRFANADGRCRRLGIGGTGSLPTVEAVLRLQAGQA